MSMRFEGNRFNTSENSISHRIPFLTLFVVWLVILGMNWWYLSVDQNILHTDERDLYLKILESRKSLLEENLITKLRALYVGAFMGRGPSYHAPAVIISLLLGPSEDAVSMVNMLFLPILLFATYGIGCRLFSKKTGLLAAVLVSLYTPLFLASRIIVSELSLASFVSLTIFCLLKSRRFSNRGWAIAAGIFLGLAALTKVAFILYLFMPVLLLVIDGIILRGEKSKDSICKQILNLLIFLLVACLIVVPWLIATEDGFQKTLHFYSYQFGQNPHATGSSFTEYFFFFRTLFGDVGLPILMMSLLLTLRRPRRAFFLLTWFIFPVMFFLQSLSPGNLIGPIQLRELAPVIPAIAIIEAYGLFQIVKAIKKKFPKSERWQGFLSPVILFLVISWHFNIYLVLTSGGLVGFSGVAKPVDSYENWWRNPEGELPPFAPRGLWLHTLTDRLDEAIAQLEDAATLRARPIVVQVYNNYESGPLGGIFFTKIKARSLVKSDSFRISLCYRSLHAEEFLEGTEGECLQNLHEVEVIVLAVNEGTRIDEWSHDAVERLGRILHNESDYELFYAMPRRITTIGWASLRESGDPIDWIAGEHGGMEDWQKDITLESLDEYAGVIYVRKGIV